MSMQILKLEDEKTISLIKSHFLLFQFYLF